MSLPANPKTTNKLLERLRAAREAHPRLDFAAGFLPVVGNVTAAQDFADDPSLLGAAGLALGPVSHLASRLRKAKTIAEVKGYHGSASGEWTPTDGKLKPRDDISEGYGQVEGEGFYQTLDPVNAAAWGSRADPPKRFKGGWDDMKYMKRRGRNALKDPSTVVYETDIPDEEFAKYLNLGDREAVLNAVEKAGYSRQEAMDYYAKRAAIHAKHLEEYPRTGPDLYQDMLPYELGGEEWGDTTKKLNKALRDQGVPGLHRPSVDRVITFDPASVNVTGRYKP